MVTRNVRGGSRRTWPGDLPNAELVVFESSAHMMFAEQQDRFPAAVPPVRRPQHGQTC